ncbi:DUF1576 domain-containing protein [Gordonia sp. PDNC005]|uniref:DUF1576 domain-containing protein n=1 Tax=unclassified Gordonia (in: high G+C Gram-positive bacteria) TaxID=2657482 RepID=UPI00196461CE|nr:DUF1576 domain-containing protein [Gordonia sp. PDNC005]QRY62543.1 DUF1576 domain-containing protein [Gordonia sp. PDNC005]
MAVESSDRTERILMRLIVATAVACIAFGFIVDPPSDVFRGIGDIVIAPDVLVTDFVVLGGLGGAFAQAGLVTLLACLTYRLTGAKLDGGAVGCLYMVLGFGLFGKTILNVWPILIGVALYALWRHEPLRDSVTTAWFATALSPVFSEIAFNTGLVRWASVPIGLATGLLIGFIVSPVARGLFRAHNGFTLYNMGFVAGILGAVIIAVFRSFGLEDQPSMTWTSGNDGPLLILCAVFIVMVLVAAFTLDRKPWRGYRALLRRTGQAPSDFIGSDGPGPTLLNMAITGTLTTVLMVAIDADFNGPVVGGIVSVIGFSACGKHAVNIVPVMIGVVLGALTKPLGLDDDGVVWAIMFGTCLAPISARFGPHWGVLAGFLHVSVAQVAGSLTIGLNLYGNGFAAGMVAAVVSPIALMFVERRESDRLQEPDVVPST